jgi:hypothetical protein
MSSASVIKKTCIGGLLACVPLALPAVAGASLGTGVGASPIMLAHTAIPGHAYTLPGVYVLNTGTVSSRYHLRVQRLSPGAARTLPTGWVTLQRNDFLLRPHRAAIIPFTVNIPRSASSGRYLSDVVASTSSARRGGGTALGAAAATLLGLTVGGSSPAIPWRTIVLALIAGLLAGTAAYGVRRSGLAVRVERR